jgi:uncharacterized lipoprotein YddW (UPF0748 family)
MLKMIVRPRRTALLGFLASLLVIPAPAAALPSPDLVNEVKTARIRLQAETPMPVTPETVGGIYQVRENGPSAQALMTYDRLLKQVAEANRPDAGKPAPIGAFKRKGLWIRPYRGDLTGLHVLEVLDNAQSLGITEIYVEAFQAGTLHYKSPSGLFPLATPGSAATNGKAATPDVELLKIYSREARRRGMKVYAWLHTLNFGQAYGEAHPEQLVRDGFGRTSGASEKQSWRVSPSHPEVRRRLNLMAWELASSGMVDGIQLDYIRYPVRLKEGDIDPSADPRNFWGYSAAQMQGFFAENPPYDTDAMRTYLSSGIAPDGRDAEYLDVWKRWLAREVEELIGGIRQRTEGRVRLSMAFFPNYYFHVNDTRLQESKRWFYLFDDLSPMCYSYYLDTYPGPYGDYNINRELSEVEAGLARLPAGKRPELVPTLVEDAPGTPATASLHHRIFREQIAYLRGRMLDGAYPSMTGLAFFTYGWLFPEHETRRKVGP